MKVPGAPGSGKRAADGKGVRREAESEGSRRRNLGPRDTNRIRLARRVRPRNRPKPDSCTESAHVNAAGTRGERCGPYPGRPHGREGERKGAGHPGDAPRQSWQTWYSDDWADALEVARMLGVFGRHPLPDVEVDDE